MNNLADIAWIPAGQAAGNLWVSAVISIIFACFGRAVRGVTTSGALAGAPVCFALLVGAGQGGFLALLMVFLLTWSATRFGYARKQKLGTAEPRAGRSAAQVAANLGIASVCALLYAVAGRNSQILVAAGAALAEAAADTVSSEIGQAIGGAPRLLTTWKPVPAGTDGAVTFAGTAAGIAAAIAVSLTGITGWRSAPICAAAGVIGTLADSLLGATLERRGLVGNNLVNFTSTAIAATVAFLITARV